MATVHVKVDIPEDDLWDGVMGSGWELWEWWAAAKWNDYDSHEMEVAAFDDVDSADSGVVTKVVTPEVLAEALAAVIAAGYRDACTGRPIVANPDTWDICVGDVILQQAVLGEVMYG